MKKSRNLTKIIAFCIISTLFLLCSCTKKPKNDIEDATIISTLNTTETNENVKPSDVITNNYTNTFFYEIKNTYSSRAEVEAEMEALQKEYLKFEVGKDSDARIKATETYTQYMKILGEWLDKYPPEDAEILAEKERLLNQYVFFQKEDLYIAENNLERNPPDEAAENLARAKENYNKAVKVQKQYDAGEITIDMALEILNVPPSKMLNEYNETTE